MKLNKFSSLLSLLLGIGLLGSWSGSGSDCWFVLFWVRQSLSISSEFPEGMASLSADMSVWMVSHIGTWLTVWRFNLQSLDLARVLNSVVFEGSLGSLLMFMLDLLWSGINLLFSLTLSTIKGASSLNMSLSLETTLIDGKLFIELSGSTDQTVNLVAGQFFDAITRQIQIR